jgi:tetratricopeptide (TPR) repeat protein
VASLRGNAQASVNSTVESDDVGDNRSSVRETGAFALGLVRHRDTRLQPIGAILPQDLPREGDHGDHPYALGVAALGAGPHEAAPGSVNTVTAFECGTRKSPADLVGRGPRGDAEAHSRAALALTPDDPDAHCNLGRILVSLGRPAEAEASCRAAIALKPDHTDAWAILGNVRTALRRLEEAERCYREALRLGSSSAPAICSNLGNVLKDLGRPGEAEEVYREALRLQPRFAEALTNLANLLFDQGRPHEAEACCREAIRLRPDLPEAHNNLGNLLRSMERFEEAEAACRAALRLRPGYLSALSNLGNALRDQSRFAEAEACYRRALDQKPDYVEALNNLGGVLNDQGRPEEAERHYRSALQLKPDYVDAHVNLALTLLLMGRLEDGWRHYEWRWEKRKHEQHRGFAQPLWEGGETGDRVLLLHAEQGFGDTLQFCRFVPLAAAGGRVILEVQRPLVDLLKTLPGVEQVVAQGDPLPPFDVHCPLLSLPNRLGTSLDTLPRASYLTADPARAAAWRERVATLEGLKIGLVWAGSPTMAADRRRSMMLGQLAPLGRLPGVSFVSLQKGPAAQQASQPPAGMVLHDWTAELRDFTDTAALIDALDLVIAVDTGVVHLAGALGKPVWLLNRYDRCWRWMIDRDDSPWYESLRQFRQPKPGDWDSVITAVCRALVQLTDEAHGPDGAARAEIAEFFGAGLAHHQAGRRREAEGAYHGVLALDPSHADSLHLLGVAALQQAKHQLALGYISEAIAQAPGNGLYHGNLGTVLKALGRLDDAEASYRTALRLKPDHADALSNLGNLLVDLARATEAETCYRTALALQPDHRDASVNLASALVALGRPEDAEEAYRTVLRHRPDHVGAHLQLGHLLAKQQRWAAAEPHYRAVLRQEPNARDALERLGEVLAALGRPQEAEPYFRAALQLSPGSVPLHINLGNALKALKSNAEAETCYRDALRLAPNSMAAHINLGTVLQGLGRHDEALRHCRTALALQPDHPAVHLNYGNVLQELEALDAAEHHFREAIRLQPNFPEAHGNLGNLLRLRDRAEEAELCCREALAQRPDYAIGHLSLGNALKEQGRLSEAEASYRTCLSLAPEDPKAHGNLGAALLELDRAPEAETCYREALRLDHSFAEAHANLATVLDRLNQPAEAEASYREALRLQPDYAEGHNNFAVLLHDQRRLDEAEAYGREAVRLRPDYAEAHVNLALTLLVAGRLAEAWPEYEWRWRLKKQAKHVRDFAQPLWNGGETGDGVLLLHAEQGFGDTLQFCRYAPIMAKGRKVVLEAQRELLPLLTGLPGLERVVAHGDDLPEFDLHCPLLSLPRVLGTTLTNIPGNAPYLAADPLRVARWRRRLADIEGLRVGLVWAGNPAMGADRHRSIPFDRFGELLTVPGVVFVSLQKGPASKQASTLGVPLLDWTDELEEFADTAALIEMLDLVISVDTAVVHLAGALGKPIWLLNRFNACWRWLQSGEDSAWYPTLRQFRQTRLGDWDDVFRNVRAAMVRLLETRE